MSGKCIPCQSRLSPYILNILEYDHNPNSIATFGGSKLQLRSLRFKVVVAWRNSVR
jgi:hypothetical protein